MVQFVIELLHALYHPPVPSRSRVGISQIQISIGLTRHLGLLTRHDDIGWVNIRETDVASNIFQQLRNV